MESKSNQASSYSYLFHLGADKLQQLETVLMSILALPIAQDTYAQIIDGKRSWQSKPSHRARQRYEEFRKNFSAQTLKLNTQVRCRCSSAGYTARADFDLADWKVSTCAPGQP